MSKGSDSGMPGTEQWESYFDAAGIIGALGRRLLPGDAIEFGCGYGTFTIPTAPTIAGMIRIRPRLEQCRAWGEAAGLRWVRHVSLPNSPWHWGMVLERP